MEIIKDKDDVFAADPKAVAVCRGSLMRLELQVPNRVRPVRRPLTPLYSRAEKYGPECDRQVTQSQSNYTLDKSVRLVLRHSAEK